MQGMVPMLRTWIIQSDLGATPLTRAMSKGTPQVNTISPLFWLTMMKEILRILNRSGADGLVIFVSRMHTYGRNFGKGAPVCFKIQTRNQSKKKGADAIYYEHNEFHRQWKMCACDPGF